MTPTRCFVYILACTGITFYVGHTQDVRQRLRAHADGTAARFTREHRPLKLVHLEQHATREAAARRERQIKGWTRVKKEALIRGAWEQLHELSRRRSKPTLTDLQR